LKICYFDAFSGISGDMTVGALLDAGADWPALQAALASLNLGATCRLEKTKRKGIAASKFTVEYDEQKKHRHLPHIEKIISAGELSAKARDNALAVFRRLGEAEANSHNVPIEKVHFHEVGAVDSICDIAGACAALDSLSVEEIYCSRINVGSGTADGIDNPDWRCVDGDARYRLRRIAFRAYAGARLWRRRQGFSHAGERTARAGRGENAGCGSNLNNNS
jgi:hypothetical protein